MEFKRTRGLGSNQDKTGLEDKAAVGIKKQTSTVCFFSFVIFYDNVTLKVVEIIDFCKKNLKGKVDAFCDV